MSRRTSRRCAPHRYALGAASNLHNPQKGYIGGAQSAALLRKYVESGDIADAAYGTFLSWHGLPSPHAIGAVRSGIPAGAPLPVACKALQTRCGVSVPIAVLLLGALAK